MTKKRARQTLLWMSALLLLHQFFLHMNTLDFINDAKHNFMYRFIAYSIAETLPGFFFEEAIPNISTMVQAVADHLKEEVFPITAYCQKYWQNSIALVAEGEEVPDYFLETDESKTEQIREVKKENSLEKAVVYTKDQLADYDFLIKTFYSVDSTTSVTSGELNGNRLALKDLSLDLSGSEPKILIYHTHGSEGFVDSKGNGKEETIIGVGDELAKILEEQYHIKTYHDRSFYDTINGKLDRSKAYTYAGNGVKKILEKYPSIEIVIDLHRDAVKADTKLITEINGKKTAKIMFFNGLSRTAKNGDISYLKNPNKEDNLAFSLQMQLAAAELYPGFTRKIYLKGYRYNLHMKPRSLLVEAGAQTNTKEEVKNAMEPLAALLYQVLHK